MYNKLYIKRTKIVNFKCFTYPLGSSQKTQDCTMASIISACRKQRESVTIFKRKLTDSTDHLVKQRLDDIHWKVV